MKKVKNVPQFLFICFIFLIKFSTAQTPIIVRPSNNNTIRIPKETPPPQRQANNPNAPISFGVLNKDVLNYFANNFSLLQFSNYIAGGKEFPTYWESSKTSTNEIWPESPKTKNWKKRLHGVKYLLALHLGFGKFLLNPFH